jgi:spermidine synthase
MGLGVGTLASYCRRGDSFQFYELNPDVVRVAKLHFTYLSDAKGAIEVIMGDGRLTLEKQAPQAFDILIIDAFTGDAIPAHLLTREAFAVYLRHLKPDGILAINVSNRHADLVRVVKGEADLSRLSMAVVRHRTQSPLGPYVSQWAILARTLLPLSKRALGPLVNEEIDGVSWTDDFSPLMQILR